MNQKLKHERGLYLLAFFLLLLNRLLIRFPDLVLPASVLADEGSWFYVVVPVFSYFALAYCVVVSWRFFRFAGVSSWPSAANALISPLLFPLILIPQMVYVLRRASKASKPTEGRESHAQPGS